LTFFGLGLAGQGERADDLVPRRADAFEVEASEHTAGVVVDDRHAAAARLLLDANVHRRSIESRRLGDELLDVPWSAAHASHVLDVGHAVRGQGHERAHGPVGVTVALVHGRPSQVPEADPLARPRGGGVHHLEPLRLELRPALRHLPVPVEDLRAQHLVHLVQRPHVVLVVQRGVVAGLRGDEHAALRRALDEEALAHPLVTNASRVCRRTHPHGHPCALQPPEAREEVRVHGFRELGQFVEPDVLERRSLVPVLVVLVVEVPEGERGPAGEVVALVLRVPPRVAVGQPGVAAIEDAVLEVELGEGPAQDQGVVARNVHELERARKERR